MKQPTIVHWTCEHGAAGIRRDGVVKPHMGLSWWTDLDNPGRRTRAALGLSSVTLKCDRMLFRVWPKDTGLLVPWPVFAETADPAFVDQLEFSEGTRPEHWWVASDWVWARSVRKVQG